MSSDGRIRILIAKPGLDGHDVGAKAMVRAFMEAGFDVTYTGLRKSPEEIVRAARELRVGVLGLSVMSGSHLPICRDMKVHLEKAGLGDLVWIVGGQIPPRDHDALKALGVAGVFPVGTVLHEAIEFVRESVR